MALTSSAFAEGEEIPVEHAGCPPGQNVSPPLDWSGVPEDAGSLAISVVDPDAGGFVHWVISGLDPNSTGLAAGEVPPDAVQAPNDSGSTEYFGPCPPETHTYVFTLYALPQSFGGEDLADVEGEATASATLSGTYTPA
jgi:Raf kinase inhibitor-like YbhB/YbcL family protein